MDECRFALDHPLDRASAADIAPGRRLGHNASCILVRIGVLLIVGHVNILPSVMNENPYQSPEQHDPLHMNRERHSRRVGRIAVGTTVGTLVGWLVAVMTYNDFNNPQAMFSFTMLAGGILGAIFARSAK